MANQESYQFLYKIVPGPPPDPIPAEYPFSDLDKQSGFVHLSKAAQVVPDIPLAVSLTDLLL